MVIRTNVYFNYCSLVYIYFFNYEICIYEIQIRTAGDDYKVTSPGLRIWPLYSKKSIFFNV
jgi:hypothetical protein